MAMRAFLSYGVLGSVFLLVLARMKAVLTRPPDCPKPSSKICTGMILLLCLHSPGTAQECAGAKARNFRKLESQAESGRADDPLKVGVAFQLGQGVDRDLAQAAHWFLKAANQGNPAAQTNLASMYLIGLGVPRDEHQAYYWFQRAARSEEH